MSLADSSTAAGGPRSARHRTIEEHRAAILALASELHTESIPVDAQALDRVLAADQVAVYAIPPFDNSAMDGFLVRREDLDAEGNALLTVAGDVAAGNAPQVPPAGAAIRIMTGAPVDTSQADLLIVPVENTSIEPGPQPLPDEIEVRDFNSSRVHIRRKGESLQAGSQCAHAGQVIDVGTLATLISAGAEAVEVYARPRVAVISTGNELQSPGSSLAVAKIPDSNSPMLAALVATCGQVDVSIARSADTPDELGKLFDALAANHDLIITTGGVAVGVYDVVREVLSKHAVQAWFGRVRHKPGGHQGLSVWETATGKGVPVLSLPGNPVAAFVSFYLYGRPLLQRLSGSTAHSHQPRVLAQVKAPLPVPRDRDILVPAVVDFTQLPAAVAPFNGTKVGSHMIGALTGVNGLLHLHSTDSAVNVGDMVEVLLIPSTTW